MLVAALLLIDWNSPAGGYELSIYESLPPLTWLFLIAALACGTAIIVHQAFAERKSRYWLLGFFVLVFAVSVILLLPAFRGYFLYAAGDTQTHVAWSHEILRLGHFGQSNRYPVTHILMAQMAELTGLSPEVVVKYVPVLLTVLFMVSSYLLATSVLPRRGQALLCAAATALLFNYYHVCAYPQALSLMILPLVFHVYFRGFGDSSAPYRIAFVILLLLFPFFHPAPAAVLIVCLASAEGAKAIWLRRAGCPPQPATHSAEHVALEPTLICSVTFFTWISAHVIFRSTIIGLSRWLGGEIRALPRAAELESLLGSGTLGVRRLVVLAVQMYGDNLLYLALSAVALYLVLDGFRNRQPGRRRLFVLSMPFLVSGPVWVLVFATTLGVTIGRLLGANIMMWATPVFAAFAGYEISSRWKRGGSIAATCVLLSAWILSVFGVYQSPLILQPSWHVSRMDVRGVEWFTAHSGYERRGQFASIGIPLGVALGSVPIPEHFGYREHYSLGESLGAEVFLVLGERARLAVVDPVLSTWMISDPRLVRRGFEESDFARLTNDHTVGRVYRNGELDVLLIKGSRGVDEGSSRR